MSVKRVLIWYRNDLRVHDHEPMYRGLQEKALIIPCYCFDRRQFDTTSFGFPKTGKYRAQFLLESIIDLRISLQKLGSNLIIRNGLPEEIIPVLVQELNIDAVYYHKEVTAEELAVENKLKQKLAQLKVKVESFWGATLYLPEDLPFDIKQIPELYTNFRKQVEKKSAIEEPISTPEQLPALPEVDTGNIPNLEDFDLETPVFDERAVLRFKGGETAALDRLQHYFWEADCLREYRETRNGMLGADYSSKFSPWLALGCISPRYIYEQVQKYEVRPRCGFRS